MKYNQLTISHIHDVMSDLCLEYGPFIDQSCEEEVIEKFFDYHSNVTLQGMTKTETDILVDILQTIFKKIMTQQLVDSE